MTWNPRPGFLPMLLAIGIVLAYLAIPRTGRAPGGGNEGDAMAALRTIAIEQAVVHNRGVPEAPLSPYSGTLDELAHRVESSALLDSMLVSGTKSGYTFAILRGGARGWSAAANPVTPGKSGSRYFFIDETGVIRFSLQGPATVTSTPLGN